VKRGFHETIVKAYAFESEVSAEPRDVQSMKESPVAKSEYHAYAAVETRAMFLSRKKKSDELLAPGA